MADMTSAMSIETSRTHRWRAGGTARIEGGASGKR
jgi:hypothetical protein